MFLTKCMTIIFVGLMVVSCKSGKVITDNGKADSEYLSSKVVLTIPQKDVVYTVNGTMKMKSGEMVQLSFLMPLLRSEVARIQLTGDGLLVVDRVNRRFVRMGNREMRTMLPKGSGLQRVETVLRKASAPNGKKSLTGQELGIPKLGKAKIELYDFSTNEVNLSPMTLSSRYHQVTVEELLQLLYSLSS